MISEKAKALERRLQATFMIAVLGRLTKDKIIKLLSVKEGKPLYFFSSTLAGFVANRAIKKSVADLLKDRKADTIEELPEIVVEAIEGGMNIYTFHVYHGESQIESVMCHGDWKNINTLDLIISRIA
jgi:hypothetical protein